MVDTKQSVRGDTIPQWEAGDTDKLQTLSSPGHDILAGMI